MLDSPHLCPAMPFATGGRSSDRIVTEAGELDHACRGPGCNQVATDQQQFGRAGLGGVTGVLPVVEVLREASIRAGVEAVEPHLARVRRLGAWVPMLRSGRSRCCARRRALGQVELTAFAPEVIGAVGRSPRRSAMVRRPAGLRARRRRRRYGRLAPRRRVAPAGDPGAAAGGPRPSSGRPGRPGRPGRLRHRAAGDGVSGRSGRLGG